MGLASFRKWIKVSRSTMKESLAARQAALLRQNAELDQKVEAIEQRRQQQLQTTKSGSSKQSELSGREPHAVLSDEENGNGLYDDDSDAAPSSPERVTTRLGLAMDLNESIESTENSPSKKNASEEGKPQRSTGRGKTLLQKKKSTGSVPSAATQLASKNVRRLKSDMGMDTVRALEDKPEELSPDTKQQAEAKGEEGDGLGLEATVRYQKARLRVLQDELDASQTEIKELQNALQQSKGKIEELTNESTALKKKQQQTQQLLEKQQELSAAQESKQKLIESQLSAAHAKIEEIQKAEKQASQQFRSKDVRLNRALEELEKVKSQLQDERRTQGEQTIAKAEHEQVLKENKRLEKQKNELLLAFKKQMKLIDLLKRQRIHMEAAKMLSFTEEEFSKTLELG